MSDISSAMRRGFLDITPIIPAAVPIGLLFGAIAASKGLSPFEVWLMSALVFAGGAQFAAVELWSPPLPIAAILFSTLLINSRHILMGASLGPKLDAFSPPLRNVALFFMIDEIWAMSERRATLERVTPAYWFTMGLILVFMWSVSSAAGAVVGAAIEDPARYGFDFVFTAMFIGLVMGFWKSRHAGAGIVAAALASALVHFVFGPPWHVLAGAAAGLIAAWAAAGRSAAA
ncbi:MAG: AzlC family ABC transporter permease [Rhodobiaceae bacterium]|nr:AzlC family ABC transporter permease [Rhodobiaceae bacterium]